MAAWTRPGSTSGCGPFGSSRRGGWPRRPARGATCGSTACRPSPPRPCGSAIGSRRGRTATPRARGGAGHRQAGGGAAGGRVRRRSQPPAAAPGAGARRVRPRPRHRAAHQARPSPDRPVPRPVTAEPAADPPARLLGSDVRRAVERCSPTPGARRWRWWAPRSWRHTPMSCGSRPVRGGRRWSNGRAMTPAAAGAQPPTGSTSSGPGSRTWRRCRNRPCRRCWAATATCR